MRRPRLRLNPTARLMADCSGARVSWFARHVAPQTLELSGKAFLALEAIRTGADACDHFAADALAVLVARDVLISTDHPTPVYVPPSLLDVQPVCIEPQQTPRHVRWTNGRLSSLWPSGVVRSRFTVPPTWHGAALRLLNGQMLQPHEWARFHGAGLVHAPQSEPILTARRSFSAERFALLASWPDPVEHRALVDYARALARHGFMDGDYGIQGKRRRHVFDDPALRDLLDRGAALAEAITGQPLVASYSFLAWYEPGGGLPAHKDKRHCTISMSIPLDGAGAWPLYLQPDGAPRQVLCWDTPLTLVFDGRHHAHARPPLPLDHPPASYLILHFQPDPERVP